MNQLRPVYDKIVYCLRIGPLLGNAMVKLNSIIPYVLLIAFGVMSKPVAAAN